MYTEVIANMFPVKRIFLNLLSTVTAVTSIHCCYTSRWKTMGHRRESVMGKPVLLVTRQNHKLPVDRYSILTKFIISVNVHMYVDVADDVVDL